MSTPITRYLGPPQQIRPEVASIPRPTSFPPIEDGIGLDEVWRIVRSRFSLILLLIFCSVIVTGIVVFSETPLFTANANLLIEPESPQVIDMTQLIADSAGDVDYDYYKTQFELLKSRVLAARVIQVLDLSNQPDFNPKNQPAGPMIAIRNFLSSLLDDLNPKSGSGPPAVELENSVNTALIDRYLSHLKVTPIPGTRLVTVSFSSSNPVLAARVVNRHVREFVSLGLEMQSDQQRTARDFLKSQLTDIDSRVRQAEGALNAYRQKNGVISFDVDDSEKTASQRMEDLTRDLTQAEAERINSESQMDLIKTGHFESLPEVVTNPAITSLRPQLIALEAEYARLSTAFNPAYPKLAELRAQLIQTKSAMAAEIQNVAASVQRNYFAALSREEMLNNEVNAEKQKDLALNNALVEDSVLARDVEANRDLYKSVLQRMQQMTVAEQTPLSNISVVEDATPPITPSTPKKAFDIALSALVAGMLGVSLSFLLNHLDNRLKSGEAIEQYLDLPNLAVVPDFARLPKLPRRGLALPASSYTPSMGNKAFGCSKVVEGHLAGKAEVYRAIRTSILFSRAGAPPKTVLFTSSVEAEGKTWTTVNTALSFARTGARTLLIDADLRRAQCHELLRSENSLGLSEVLVGQVEPEGIINHLVDHSLDFLSAGSPVPNPAELLTSARMREVLVGLTRAFDFILIDSAPLMYASDTIGLATMVEGVVMVIGAHTSKQVALRARSRLSQINAHMLGSVLNRVNINHPDYNGDSRCYLSYEN